jgi:hypothetical protein
VPGLQQGGPGMGEDAMKMRFNTMKSELTEDEVEALLQEAEDEYPDSDFVASVKDWFIENGFITEAQEEALHKIAEGRRY